MNGSDAQAGTRESGIKGRTMATRAGKSNRGTGLFQRVLLGKTADSAPRAVAGAVDNAGGGGGEEGRGAVAL